MESIRALVKILRSNGSMNGVISSDNKNVETCLKIIKETPIMEGLNYQMISTNQDIYGKILLTRMTKNKLFRKAKKLKIVAIDSN